MIKRIANYEDFEGNMVSEELYFNLTQTELVSMSMDMPDDIAESIGDVNNIDQKAASAKIAEKLGSKGIFEFIKDLLIKSYGIRTPDGRGFKKTKEITENFASSLAFDAIFMELITDDVKAAEFINGVIPVSVMKKITENNSNAGNAGILPMN